MKKKWIVWGLCLIVAAISVAICFAIKPVQMPKPLRTIVIDAGHGGIDDGSVGASGKKESEINLNYALTLAKMFEELEYNVVLTRKDENGLYSARAANKKKSDMQARKNIIDSSGAAAVISVHMNSFSLPSCHGAQVFYAKDNALGQGLAESVQSKFVENISGARKTADVGDYYILNCTPKPAILVEFGFISNPSEEKLLLEKDYMQKTCYCVVSGVIEFFQM